MITGALHLPTPEDNEKRYRVLSEENKLLKELYNEAIGETEALRNESAELHNRIQEERAAKEAAEEKLAYIADTSSIKLTGKSISLLLAKLEEAKHTLEATRTTLWDFALLTRGTTPHDGPYSSILKNIEEQISSIEATLVQVS